MISESVENNADEGCGMAEGAAVAGQQARVPRVPGGRGLLLLVLAAALGCGRSEGLVPVSGTVSLDGSPLDNALVRFHPQPGVKGNGGHGLTDPTGRFSLISPQGNKGVFPGDYAVSVSRPELPPKLEQQIAEAREKGIAPTIAPSEMKESLPLVYTKPETTPLKQTVGTRGESEVVLQLDSTSIPARPDR